MADKLLYLCSLFDDGEVRYRKLRESISQFTITQIGKLLSSGLLVSRSRFLCKPVEQMKVMEISDMITSFVYKK